MKKILLFLATAQLLVSCATKKQIVYFQDAPMGTTIGEQQKFVPVIESNDILHISVSSMNDDVLVPFRRNNEGQNNANNNNPGLQGYLVNADGNIRFPVIGEFPVAGKTRDMVVAELSARLKEFITDIVLDVRIINFKVTVLGEVNNPGVYTINDERVTVPQALGLAGDLSEDGKRGNIMVIREENGKQTVTKLDLRSTDFFNSPYYFLKQNDILYVEPSLKGVKKSGFIPDVPAMLSLVTVVLSTVILLTR